MNAPSVTNRSATATTRIGTAKATPNTPNAADDARPRTGWTVPAVDDDRRFALEDELWRDRARCAGWPTYWWFTPSGFHRHGKALCGLCEVRAECGEYRQRNGFEGGWAGVYVDPKRPRRKGAE